MIPFPEAYIVNLGNELLRGFVSNTNASYLAKRLTLLGFNVVGMMTVGDAYEALSKVLENLRAKKGLCIVAGGPGSAFDDITRKVASRTFGRPLTINERVLEELKRLYGGKVGVDRAALERQALFPLGAEPIPNPLGMAWGFSMREDGGLYLFLPGTPKELEAMFEAHVEPLLREAFQLPELSIRSLRVFGLPEIEVEEIVRSLTRGKDLRWGIRVDFPEVVIDVSLKDDLCKGFLEGLRMELHPFLFSEGERIEEVVGRKMRERRVTIFLAESCTGGLIGHRITSVPGSSEYFKGGVVAYHNEVKERLLGVPYHILHLYGAVSKEVAAKMAEGARRCGKTDIGLSVTGIAGPGGGSKEKPVGTVYVGLSDGRETIVKGLRLSGSREEIKTLSCRWALEILRRYLEGIDTG